MRAGKTKTGKINRPWYLLPGLVLFGLGIPGFISLDQTNTAYTRLQREQEASQLAGNLQVMLLDNQGQLSTDPEGNQDDQGNPENDGPGPMGRSAPVPRPMGPRGIIQAPGLAAFDQAARSVITEESGSGIRSLGIWQPRTGMIWKTGKDTRDLDSLPLLNTQWQRLPYGDLVFHGQDGSTMIYLRPLLRGPARRMANPDPELRGMFLVQAWQGGDLAWAGSARRFLIWSIASLVWAALLAMMLLLRRNQILQDNLGRTQVLARAGQAARTLAHEVRTPLAIMLLQSSILRKELDPPHHQALDRIQAEIRRIQAMSSRLARLVKEGPGGEPGTAGAWDGPPGQGAGPEHQPGSGQGISPDSPGTPATRIRTWTGGLLSTGTWPLLEIVPGPDLEAEATEETLFTILSNLLNNAREADPETPLTITWRYLPPAISSRKGSMELSVRDLAGGMSWFRKRRIFEAWFSTKDSGMGLGLKLSRDLARSSGGDLTCRFRHGRDGRGRLRKGMEFMLSIPARLIAPAQEDFHADT